jgi:hypothetical protein
MVGYVSEPPNSDWRKSTIRDILRTAYEQVERGTGETTTVAALWIRGNGVYLGSIPHGGGQQVFRLQLPEAAPKLFAKISQRQRTVFAPRPDYALYHAEDMAMFEFESNRDAAEKDQPYPDGAYMAAYGRAYGTQPPAFRQPCTGPDESIIPACRWTLDALGIDHWPRKRKLR